MTRPPEQAAAFDDDAATAPNMRRTPADPYIGLEIEGRYRVERKLGAGGMGRVYLGKHLRTGASLAIKVVEAHPARGSELQTRCFNEARAMMEVRSSHVAHAIDVGTLPHGELYLVLEYLRGEDLEVLLRREGPLPWTRLGPIALQLCSGLGSAHRQGIIHRDIKPSNCVRITIDDNPDHIKIIDFGIARDVDAPTGPTQKGTVIGTPDYLAPELVTGDARAGIRTDIYALGATLYKLLTGVAPFRGDSAFEVMGKHVLGERIPPSRVAPQLAIPAAVDAIILRALAANPSERYASTDELAQAICAVLGIRRAGVSGAAFSLPATAVLPQGSVMSGEPRPFPLMGHGSTAETVAPRAVAARAVTLLSTIGIFVVATQLVKPADASPDVVTANAPTLVDHPPAKSPELRSPTQRRTNPRLTGGSAEIAPKDAPHEAPPPSLETQRAPSEPAPIVAPEPGEATQVHPPSPSEAKQNVPSPETKQTPPSSPEAKQDAPPSKAKQDAPVSESTQTPPASESKQTSPGPKPPSPTDAQPSAPVPPPTDLPPAKPRPEANFPYTAARSEIAQQLKYLRTTCMMTGGRVTSSVKFRVDVTPGGTADIRVYSADGELRACFRKALSFPFGKSPRGGAFVYTLTQSSADFVPVPLDKAGKP
ncbi:serine/threonine-protein kinase [Nannocystis bainbridge]|uniref:Protein kinase n=1 Tax=Nannocystis bainbridge TaxID=2995303 RepID=A0ABT5DWX5_9BACT|nr:serine/threonine-protein kinase [Nannocystis bainbridge]MDC0718117.1 protein kinase [Nannocystis bainbridge]